MIELNHQIKSVNIHGKEYKCVIPNQVNDLFKKSKTDLKFLCLLLLYKNCKFFNKDGNNKNALVTDYCHILEIPVNKFEKIEISVYTLSVMNENCFTFQSTIDSE